MILTNMASACYLPPNDGNSEPSDELGLHATSDGALIKDGRQYRGIGVNYFDAFYRNVKDVNDVTYDAGFATLSDLRIPFVRVMAGEFWPSEQRLYLSDPAEFFRRFDRFVRSAEDHGIGLVLTLFWNASTVPELEGEPIGAWGDSASKTRLHMTNYVRDVVTRYRYSPSVWGWELGNEWSLAASLPNVSGDLTVEQARSAYGAFVSAVRCYDATRIISSGNSIPRDSAWHNWHEDNWTLDTAEQSAEMLRDDNPTDTISIHTYTSDIARIEEAAAVATQAGKPLFLGEFGAPGSDRVGEADFDAALRAIEKYDVDLAALWVFDYTDQPEWSVTALNSRSWQLREVAAANATLQARE